MQDQNQNYPLDTFRLGGVGQYRYNFALQRWLRTWTLEAIAQLASDAPVWRSYLTGHEKPSAEVSAHQEMR